MEKNWFNLIYLIKKIYYITGEDYKTLFEQKNFFI